MDSQPPNNDDLKPAKRSFLDRFRATAKATEEPEVQEPVKSTKVSFTERMRSALSRTGEGLGALFLGTKAIDTELLDELETALLLSLIHI